MKNLMSQIQDSIDTIVNDKNTIFLPNNIISKSSFTNTSNKSNISNNRKSNLSSPHLYYNKNITEKFDSVKYI